MAGLGVILLLIGIGGCLFLPTHFKLPKVLREEESEQKAFRILLIVIIVGFVGAMACFGTFSGSSSSSSSPKAGGVKCEICGGGMKCEICGESGLYCENSQFGSGTDHYCGEHWADVIEWHNK